MTGEQVMADKRHKPNDGFIQFLLDELRFTQIMQLSRQTGKSPQLLTKYADNGVDDLGKRIELVDLCGIPRGRLKAYIDQELDSRPRTA